MLLLFKARILTKQRYALPLKAVTATPLSPLQRLTQFLSQVPWCDMPLEILHSYRHAYKLNTPSAFSTDYSSLLLSSGIGLRSPTSLAARRNQIYRSQQAHEVNGPSAENSFPNAVDGKTPHADQSGPPYAVNEKSLHKVVGQGRVNKNQLVQAVRKHFNNAGLGEQDAITRFLYKVHEESRGHQFRLRFQS